jgi:hypothetical protein
MCPLTGMLCSSHLYVYTVSSKSKARSAVHMHAVLDAGVHTAHYIKS